MPVLLLAGRLHGPGHLAEPRRRRAGRRQPVGQRRERSSRTRIAKVAEFLGNLGSMSADGRRAGSAGPGPTGAFVRARIAPGAQSPTAGAVDPAGAPATHRSERLGPQQDRSPVPRPPARSSGWTRAAPRSAASWSASSRWVALGRDRVGAPGRRRFGVGAQHPAGDGRASPAASPALTGARLLQAWPTPGTSSPTCACIRVQRQSSTATPSSSRGARSPTSPAARRSSSGWPAPRPSASSPPTSGSGLRSHRRRRRPGLLLPGARGDGGPQAGSHRRRDAADPLLRAWVSPVRHAGPRSPRPRTPRRPRSASR